MSLELSINNLYKIFILLVGRKQKISKNGMHNLHFPDHITGRIKITITCIATNLIGTSSQEYKKKELTMIIIILKMSVKKKKKKISGN